MQVVWSSQGAVCGVHLPIAKNADNLRSKFSAGFMADQSF
jgi:hypothetical protein